MPLFRTLLASGAVLLVGGGGLTVATDHLQAFTSETARLVEIHEHPRPLPAVTLETQNGAHVTLADLRGKWVLVDFIYTRCTTFCSVLGGEFAQLQTQLATPIARGKVQLLSISFDPDHDTPQQLAGYLARFGDHAAGWMAARPTNANGLRDLKRTFGITVVPDGYGGFIHNAAIEIVDPEGRLVDVFPLGNPGLVGQTLLRDMQ